MVFILGACWYTCSHIINDVQTDRTPIKYTVLSLVILKASNPQGPLKGQLNITIKHQLKEISPPYAHRYAEQLRWPLNKQRLGDYPMDQPTDEGL